MRISEHPILGIPEQKQVVEFSYDGNVVNGLEGEPVAAALKAAGVIIHRYTSKHHSPRGIFCAIGRCTDCVMVVDGIPNVRTCVTPLEAGMDVRTQYGVSVNHMNVGSPNGVSEENVDGREQHEASVKPVESNAQNEVSVKAEAANEIEEKGR